MSEQEKSGQSDTKESSLVVVEQGQSAGSDRQMPYRPTDLQDDQPELHHKRSKAPAVPSVVEELISDSVPTVHEEKSARKIHEHASSEKHKNRVSKKSSTKNRGSSASPSENMETIPLKTIEVEPAREKISLPAQPIPADVTSVSGVAAGPTKHAGHVHEDDNIVQDDVAELRTREATKRTSEWSDVEEAGGLSRSESRASRVSRVVRQLFCCGTAYSPPSEDEIPNAREQSGV